MKKTFKILSVLLLLSMLSIEVFAQNTSYANSIELQDTLQRNVISTSQTSKVLGTPRGRILSSGGIQISDEGSGVIGVYADTLCHTDVKQIAVTVFLEIWNEKAGDWQYLDSYEQIWNASDNSGGKLSAAVISFDWEGFQRGREYRLSAYHFAESFDGVTEAMMSRTNGITLK